MELVTLLSSLGISPALSTRPATALLILAAAMQFSGVAGPAWLIGYVPIALLLLFAIVEWNLGKDVALLELVEIAMPFIKSGLAVAVALAMTTPEASNVLAGLMGESAVSTPLWQTILQWGWALVVGVATWFASLYRQSILFFVTEFDEDNDLGLMTLYSWMEGIFTATSVLLVLIAPLLAIIFYILVAIALRWLRNMLEQQEEKKRILCTNDCGTLIYGSALICPTCTFENQLPLKVGLLGQTTTGYVTDRVAQHWELIAQKRCPRCATRFHGRSMDQVCEACGESVLESPKAVYQYVAYFEQRLPKTLGVCFIAGFVPILGIVVGVTYYRLMLVSPLRRYVPTAQGCLGRWGTRLINLILLSLQPIPVLGAFVLPLMCLLNFRVYRSLMVQSQFRPKSPQPQVSPA